MFKYFSHTNEDVEKMLKTIGVEKIEDLFNDIPTEAIYKDELSLPDCLSEIEIRNRLHKIAALNKTYTCFLGAGSYDVYTPSVIQTLTSRQEFLTSYTPYQAEISQGTLQYIFEFQTMICELTGLEVSNASMYDGPTATAETILMATSQTRRNKVLVSKTLSPHNINVINTYAKYKGIDIEYIEANDYLISLPNLESKLNDTVAGVIVQNPNYFGIIEDYTGIVEKIHDNKSLFIMNVDPSTLSVLKTPGEYGADIACGDGQTLGIPLSFGGPYVGFLATTKKLMRKLPGRIVGLTKDIDGKRGYVLTLQAREQHIRREKANSNICSNQSLMALTATIYTSLMGKQGMKDVGLTSFNNAHYLKEQLLKTKQFIDVSEKEFFKEFLLKGNDLKQLNEYLLDKGFLGGLIINNDLYLLCATEMRTKEEIDNFVSCVEAFYVR